MNHEEAIEMMLKNLDDWRNLPKYQMERRVDLFFGLVIRQIVAGHLGYDLERIHPLVIPEFPFRYNENGTDTNHTVNFDYVLFSGDLTTMYIVELKTDPDSYRDEQEKYLIEAAKAGFTEIIDGIDKVMDATATNKRGKYNYLRGLLAREGLVSEEGPLAALKQPTIELLYLGPLPRKRDTAERLKGKFIELRVAADILTNTGGVVECRFAEFLREWENAPAGSLQ